MLEIRDLVRIAREEPTEQTIAALWLTVFRQQAWYFLPSVDETGPSTPSVMMVDDEPWLMAFTNFRRLRDVARAQGRINDKSNDLNMLILNPMESMRRIREHADVIRGVVFNPSSDETFRAEIDAMKAYADFFGVID